MQQIFRETKSEMYFWKNPTLDFAAHIHDDLELVYVKSGGGTAYCDGNRYELTPGSWFFAFPNQVHYYTGFGVGEYFLLIMKPASLLRYSRFFAEGVPDGAMCHFASGEDDGMGYLMETACREYNRDGFSDVIAAYLTALVGKLLPFYKISKRDLSRDNVQRILQFCEEHYREDLSVASVAENLSISRSCVSHVFGSRIGMNFCDYVNALRLREAEAILYNERYSMAEIAELSGFSTTRTFHRAFSKKHGVSPSAYRKNLAAAEKGKAQ